MTPDERAAFLERRRTGIGGSDVAPILGLSPWATPLDIYLEKRGEAPPKEETEEMLWGNLHEPHIRSEYARRTGREVAIPEMLVHPKHPFAIANLDGLTRCGRVLEIKTAKRPDGWGEDGSDEIPEAYALQVQHYLMVSGREVADVAALIAGSDFRLYEVEADRELHEMLLEAESAFWQRVVDGVPPEPRTYEEAAALFARAPKAAVEADDEVFGAWTSLVDVRAQIKTLVERESALKAAVACAMGDVADTLTHAGRVIATWKTGKAPERFDAAAFRAAHPDLAAEFTRAGKPSRPLLIKDPK